MYILTYRITTLGKKVLSSQLFCNFTTLNIDVYSSGQVSNYGSALGCVTDSCYITVRSHVTATGYVTFPGYVTATGSVTIIR